MIARKSMVLLYIALFVGVTLFAGLALAEGPPAPEPSCDLLDETGHATGYTLTKNTTSTRNWSYTINGFTGSQVALIVPVCWPEPTSYHFGSSWTLQSFPFPSASGDNYPATFEGFGAWTAHSPNLVYTATNIGATTFSFSTGDPGDPPVPKGFMPVQLKKGRDMLYCMIEGPGCDPIPIVPPVTSAVESYGLGTTGCIMQITFNQNNGRILSAAIIDDGSGSCTGPGPLTIEDIAYESYICTVPGDESTCMPTTFVQKNVLVKSGDNTCYSYYTTTGQRVSRCW